MKYLRPKWAGRFACAASACPDSCCRAGWEIIPDAETLKLYRSLPGEVGARIRAGIVPALDARPDYGGEEPLLRQDSKRVCVLLDPDGLCCVQRSFGHEALCRVCREYPRFHREFGALTELGISLSCPTAYALAVGEAPAWEEWEDEAPPVPNELDPEAYLRLRKGRALALDLLARQELPLFRRLDLVRRLAAALEHRPRHIQHNYETRLNRWETLPVYRREGSSPAEGRGRAFRSATGGDSFPGRHRRRPVGRPEGSSRCAGMSLPYALARRFLELEIISPAWKDALERFLALAEAGTLPDGLPEDPEPYARWLWCSLYKYWLDALEDGRLLARVDRSLDMLLLGMAMDRALPGEGPFLRRISREIEHCEENLAALLMGDR